MVSTPPPKNGDGMGMVNMALGLPYQWDLCWVCEDTFSETEYTIWIHVDIDIEYM